MNGGIVVSILQHSSLVPCPLYTLNMPLQDFDGGLIGSTVTQAYLNATGSQEQVSWAVVSPDNFPNGESGVIDAVLNERCWVAVVSKSDQLFSLPLLPARYNEVSFLASFQFIPVHRRD